MPDAHDFRVQAELYLELSRRMSLRGDAEYCRVRAARCSAMAIECESGRSSSAPAALSLPPENEGRNHAAADITNLGVRENALESVANLDPALVILDREQ